MDNSQLTDLPEFGDAVLAAASLAVALIGWLIGRATGRKAPVALMTILHSAVASVAAAAIKRRLTASEAAELLFEHLLGGSPETTRKLKPSPAVLGTLLEGALGRAAADQRVTDAGILRENVAAEVIAAAAKAMGR
ncbi:hypothetical protein [Paracoccus homiensis]|uniref:Uncharacterized protein n=1 Tax=Paracoccus homiensis TaxID=364199 RepID=A0A1H9YAJ7_9RHOB|nr:hypothetical protein [Paracoccus homiensis]SES65893.1 hypothetical protein SAMN04489858_10195 [Paracoccus homiensis]